MHYLEKNLKIKNFKIKNNLKIKKLKNQLNFMNVDKKKFPAIKLKTYIEQIMLLYQLS